MTGPSEKTVGRYFLDAQGELWRHISYCAQPTATMEKVGTAAVARVLGSKELVRRGGAIGSPILSGFRLLVPEEQPEPCGCPPGVSFHALNCPVAPGEPR